MDRTKDQNLKEEENEKRIHIMLKERPFEIRKLLL